MQTQGKYTVTFRIFEKDFSPHYLGLIENLCAERIMRQCWNIRQKSNAIHPGVPAPAFWDITLLFLNSCNLFDLSELLSQQTTPCRPSLGPHPLHSPGFFPLVRVAGGIHRKPGEVLLVFTSSSVSVCVCVCGQGAVSWEAERPHGHCCQC